jgi:hypothetical protein
VKPSIAPGATGSMYPHIETRGYASDDNTYNMQWLIIDLVIIIAEVMNTIIINLISIKKDSS